MRRLNGFSLGADTYADQPWLGGGSTTGGGTKPNVMDSISKWLGIGQQAAQVYNTVKNPTTGGGSSGPIVPPPPPPPDNTGLYMKYGLIALGTVVVGSVVYKLVSSGKEKD